MVPEGSNVHKIEHSNPQDGTTKLSRTVGHQTSNDAVQFPRTAEDKLSSCENPKAIYFLRSLFAPYLRTLSATEVL